ncbi:MAG: thioredoxin [Candidatus Cloacimonadota bacterium]|nr:MAG: thioredoxin [Candidatus Cloacimonadota bacterium]
MEIKSKDEFDNEVLKSDIPVLVDFWAPWCGPCQMVSPVVEELAEDYSGKMKVCKMNVEEVPSVAQTYNIMGIPTIALFKNGKIVEQIVGALPKSAIEEKIKPHI